MWTGLFGRWKGWCKRVKIMHNHWRLILAVTTETGRLQIQRQAWQLILAPDVNESGHVALFVKPKRSTHVVTFFSHCWICCSHISGQSLYIAQEGWNQKNFHRLTFHKWKFLLFGLQRTPLCILLELAFFGLPNAKECDHVSSPFWFDKQSHMTQIINIWRQNQLSHVSLNLRSTCLGSILWILNLPQYSLLAVAVY